MTSFLKHIESDVKTSSYLSWEKELLGTYGLMSKQKDPLYQSLRKMIELQMVMLDDGSQKQQIP
jgi:hypothetical protein